MKFRVERDALADAVTWAPRRTLPLRGCSCESHHHGGTRPSANAARVRSLQGRKAVVGVHAGLSSLIQLVGKDVQHELAVAVRVDVSVGLQIQVTLQLVSIDQIAVVSQTDAVRTVDIKWLSLGVGTTPRGWVSQMT